MLLSAKQINHNLNEALSAVMDKYKVLHDAPIENKSTELDKHLRETRKTASIKKAGVGTSRIFYNINEPDTINLDGKHTAVKTGMKLAYLGSLDHDKVEAGIKQNRNEADPKFKDFHILQKTSDGYKTNEDGVLLPTLDHDKSHHLIQVLHAEPLSAKNKLEDHTKTKEFPNGISGADVEKHVYNNEGNISNHPFIKQIDALKKTHKIGDIHSENIGIFTHPITGKKYPVITDYGM